MLLSCSIFVHAQETDKAQKAFQSSYESESKGDYTTAIQQITSVYKAESYAINIRLGWLNYVSGRFTEALP
ncbi:MAG TPA: hypothetical protein PK855_11140, partial [Bacteroidales bacterium]|nr:hypothetical protein [Bacteroidales bacterium]